MKHSEKIRIVFDGPPSHESGRFIEVENEHGEGMSLGGWKQEGELWYLEFSNPAQLEAENEALREHHKRLWLAIAQAQIGKLDFAYVDELIKEAEEINSVSPLRKATP